MEYYSVQCDQMFIVDMLKKGTYQAQINLSVRTMETSIRVIGSTFKGHGGLNNFIIWTRPWIG